MRKTHNCRSRHKRPQWNMWKLYSPTLIILCHAMPTRVIQHRRIRDTVKAKQNKYSFSLHMTQSYKGGVEVWQYSFLISTFESALTIVSLIQWMPNVYNSVTFGHSKGKGGRRLLKSLRKSNMGVFRNRPNPISVANYLNKSSTHHFTQ